MTRTTSMSAKGRHFAWAGYGVAVMLVLSLLTELSPVLQGTAPSGGIQWRFAFMGFAIGALPQTMLGWLAATITAALLGHGRTARVLAGLQGIFALLLIIGIGFFILDYLQIRVNVTPEALPFLDGTAIRSGVIGSLAGVCMLGLASGSWNVGTRLGGPKPTRLRTDPAQHIVRRG